MFVDVIKCVCNCVKLVLRCGGCSFIGLYYGLCQQDVKFMFW